MVLGSFFFFASVIQQLDFWAQNNESQRRLLLFLAPRRVQFARPWIEAFEPALT